MVFFGFPWIFRRNANQEYRWMDVLMFGLSVRGTRRALRGILTGVLGANKGGNREERQEQPCDESHSTPPGRVRVSLAQSGTDSPWQTKPRGFYSGVAAKCHAPPGQTA